MRVMVTGGGTGGHIYPALSIVEGIRARVPAAEFLYVGSARGLEADLVPARGVPFRTVDVHGLAGKALMEAVRGLFFLSWAGLQARKAIREFRPDVVVGTGGYVSGPVCLLAALGRIPLFLQEQNSLPGVTNRFLGRFAGGVAVPDEEARKHFPRGARVLVTGNPVRPDLLQVSRTDARECLRLDADRPVLLIAGGSRGARTINEAAVAAIPAVMGSGRGVQVILITGRTYFDEIGGRLQGLSATDGGGSLRILPYSNEMPLLLAAADLVVARAGGITLAEITARGLPAILVPSPNVSHNHQEWNARVLERHGAARVIKDGLLDGNLLASCVRELLHDDRARTEMASRSRELGRPGALDQIVTAILRLAQGLPLG